MQSEVEARDQSWRGAIRGGGKRSEEKGSNQRRPWHQAAGPSAWQESGDQTTRVTVLRLVKPCISAARRHGLAVRAR